MNPETENFANDSIKEEIFEKTGLEAIPVSDILWHHESEDKGDIIIEIISDDMLEEDMLQMEKGETILDESQHRQIVEEAYKDTIKMLGDYIPNDKLQRLFPGIDISELESYDFSLAKIKVSILSIDDYFFLRENLYPDKNSRGVAGFTTPTVKSFPSPLVNREMFVDLSENKIVVLNELPESVKYRLERRGGALPRELNEEERDLVAINIKATVIHEFLHTLDVSTDLPNFLKEGITEWYAQQVVLGEVGEIEEFKDTGLWVAYQKETQVVSILVNAMLEGGLDEETIDRALLSPDPVSRKKMVDFLTTRYGDKETEKIMSWKFDTPEESLDFVAGLEAKQDSDIGRFLKSYYIPNKS